MRRLFAFIGMFTLLGLLVSSLVLAAEPQSWTSDEIPVTPPPAEPVNVVAPLSLDLVPLDAADIAADAAGDDCAAAADLGFIYDTVLRVGGITDVSGYSTGLSDRSLSCMSSSATSSKGYRSAWYKFTAPVDGQVVIEAATNADYKRNYDTVIAIYRDDSLTPDTCSDLVEITCNDDFNGLLSRATADVLAGNTYRVVVVDHSLAVPGQVLLNIEATLIPNTSWEAAAPLASPLSRHAVVISDTFAYVLGGTSFSQRNGTLRRFNTTANSWATLANWPAALTANGSGYANTDAVLVKNEIHVPTGGAGGAADYDGTHWVYNINNNTWQTMASKGGPILNWGGTAAGAPVGYTQLVSYKSGTQTGFYVVGGLTGTFLDADASQINPTTTFYRYLDTGISQSWQLSLPQMTRPRYAHVAERIGNFICVVGGLSVNNNSSVVITDGECYDETSGTWLANVGDLNTPRYLAGSAVAPGGRWIVFGGISAQGQYVSTMEEFNFTTGTWTELPPQYNIGTPPLAWMRGDFIGDTLWLFGGEQQGTIPVSLVQSKQFEPVVGPISATAELHLPLIFQTFSYPPESPAGAPPLGIGVAVQGNFSGVGDVYELYRFNWNGGAATITLSNIPAGSDYDLLLYNFNKDLLGLSQKIGSANEVINASLPAGSYFVVVARSAPPPSQFPSGQPFTLVVTN